MKTDFKAQITRRFSIEQARELAEKPGRPHPGVAYALIRGDAISKSNGYRIKT
jgi:hypothetical protein